MKKFILASTIALGLAACNPPAPNPEGGTKLGPRLLEVTINLANNDASAKILEPSRQSRTVDLSSQSNTALNITRVGVGFHDDNDQPNPTLTPTRYFYGIFRIENNTGTPLNNFTAWALNVPTASGTVTSPTLFGTMFKKVQDATGADITDGTVIRSIEPTHGIRPDLGSVVINPNHADLQIFSAAEKTEVGNQLAATYGGLVADVLGYGFVGRKTNGNARDIAATNGVPNAASSCTADSCKGFLTFAFKVPLNAVSTTNPRSSRPSVFSFVAAIGDQSAAYTTQSIKDQKDITIAGQPTTTFFGTPRLLGGSTTDFKENMPENLCQVETARSSSTFTTSVLMPATVDTTAGTLDTCFGSGGLLEGSFGATGVNIPRASILDSQGRILVVGQRLESGISDFFVYRLKSDGQLDTTFNSPNGFKTINFGGNESATGVALDSSNRIDVVGTRDNIDIVATRLNDDGTLDTTFNATGAGGVTAGKMVLTSPDTEQATGVDVVGTTIFISGSFSSATNVGDFLVAKVRSDGTADTTFGTNGLGFATRNIGVAATVDAANSIEAISDTEIYVAGTTDVVGGGARDWAVAKLNSSGLYDNTFNGNGRRSFDPNFINLGGLRTLDSANAIKLDSAGRLVIVGSSGGASDSDLAIARMTTTGGFDNTFDTDGVRIRGIGGFDFGTSLAFTSTGSIMVGGYTDLSGNNDFVANKFSATNGTFLTQYGPTDFNSQTTLNDRAQSVMVNSSGKVILVGATNGGGLDSIAIAQYNP